MDADEVWWAKLCAGLSAGLALAKLAGLPIGWGFVILPVALPAAAVAICALACLLAAAAMRIADLLRGRHED